jgi:hypothetical protein
MKLRLEYLGETKENLFHIITFDESVDKLIDGLLKRLPPIFRTGIKDKFAKIHQVRKARVELLNYTIIVELKGGANYGKRR